MIIQHNLMSLNAHRQLGGNTNLVSKNLEKLSSGFKINRAGDDAAGLAISEKMRAQITGLTRAQANAQDGISLVQTAEGALTEVHSMLNRMVDLATQSSNGTMQADDRQKIQDEMDALTSEIDRISESTNFNGINLLNGDLAGGGTAGSVTGGYSRVSGSTTAADGTVSGITSGTVAGAKAKLDLTVKTASTADKDVTLKVDFILDGKTHSITFKANDTKSPPDAASNATEFMKDADAVKAFKDLGITVTDGTGKLTFELDAAKASDFGIFKTTTINDGKPVAAEAAITTATVGKDVKMSLALGSADGVKAQFEIDGKKFQIVKTGEKADAGYNALYTDTGTMKTLDANQAVIDQLKDKYNIVAENLDTAVAGSLQFKKGTATAGTGGSGDGLILQIGDTADDFNKVTVSVANMGIVGLGIDDIKVGEQGVAAESIATIKAAIETVSVNRSAMGALQNRLEHTINNLGVATENMTAAESRVRDVDMAKEMMTFTKNNVLTQAAQAMLAQANQQPQQVLQLLR